MLRTPINQSLKHVCIQNKLLKQSNRQISCSKVNQHKLLFIRNPETEFGSSHQGITWENESLGGFQHDLGVKKIDPIGRYSREHIDTPLSFSGIVECLNLKKHFENNPFSYDLILLSPLLRSLSTCKFIFGNHNVPKIVIPQLTEAIRFSCDLSKSIKLKEKLFPDFDFTQINSQNPLWFLEHQPLTTQRMIKRRLNRLQIKTREELESQLLRMMREKLLLQTDGQLQQRAKKIKRAIDRYQQKYDRIIIISHSHILRYLSSQQTQETQEPMNYYSKNNSNSTPYMTPLAL